MRGGATQNHPIFQQFKYTLHIFLEIRIITFFWELLAENYYCKTRTCFWALLLGRHIYPAFIVMSQSFMLYCTHIQPSATGINICNTAQLIKSQTAFLFFFFCKTHIGESERGGNVHAVTIKRKEIWLYHVPVFLLHYTYTSKKYTRALCPSTISLFSPLPSFLNNINTSSQGHQSQPGQTRLVRAPSP